MGGLNGGLNGGFERRGLNGGFTPLKSHRVISIVSTSN